MAGIVNGELKVKKDWEKKKIDDCFVQIINGANIKQVKDGNGIPITRIETISNDVFNRDRMGYANISDAKNYEKYILQDNTILMSHINSMKFLGRSVLYEKMNDEIIIHGMNLLNLIPASFIQPKYACLYFQTSKFRNDIKSISHQSVNQASFNITSLKSISIPVPPLEEQKRIVKILDEKFAQLETIKTNAQTNLQNAKDLFQSQLTKTFSNTTWEKKRLQDCSSIIGDGLHGTPKYDENGNYYFINGSNLTITDIVFTPETKRVNKTEYQKYKVELNENTVFLSINGSTLGKRTAFYNNEPVILGKSACYINVKSNTLNKYFLRHFLSSDIFQEYAWKEKTGAAIPNLGLKAMRDLKIPLPPLPEQKCIVKELDTLSEKVRQLQKIYTKQIANCDELKQSYLQKAFEGEL